jgi:thioesterase domain-containing protein
LIHMGRKDFQIKIRGNRVEVTEIEAELLKLDAIRAAVVHAQANDAGEQRLIAYVVPDAARAPTISDLRRALAPRLPDYMMPSAFVFLESIPVVPNGRVDRSALPVPSSLRPELETAFVAARTSVEKALVGIWSEVLSLDQIGIDDDFFALGGHSLLAAKMFAVFDEKFGRSYPLSLLLSSPTIRKLAEHYSRPQETRRKLNSLVPLRSRGSQRPIFAVPGVFGNVLGFVELAREFGEDRPFYALQSVGLDGLQPPFETIEAMVEEYIKEIRSVQNSGPYVIIGACFGASVAYEIAHELMATGDEVVYLGLIDPNNLESRSDDAIGGVNFTAWNKGRAIVSLLSSRIKFYVEELRHVAGHERLHYLLRKAVSVGATLSNRNKTRPLTRELHQLEVANANRRALRRYHRRPLVGELKTFEVFESNHPRNSRSHELALQMMWNGKVNFYHCPARDSGDMIAKENAVELARMIADHIDTVHRVQVQ